MASKGSGQQLESTGIYVIAVGYEQEPKCQVLNAMSGDRRTFRQFSCRTRPELKPLLSTTISGRGITLVQTASLNTPAWNKTRAVFNKEYWKKRKCVYVYIATNRSSADDTAAIKSIKDTFGENLVRSVLCFSTVKHSTMERTNTFEFQYTFQLDDYFETKVSKSRKVLNDLKDLVGTPMVIPGPSAVGSQEQKSTKTKPSEDYTVFTDAIKLATTVEVPETEYTPEVKQTLTQRDWNLFRHTLRYGKARSNHVRVNVVGNHGVGKTTIVNRLLMKSVQCPDTNAPPTENLEIYRVVTRCVEQNGEKIWENEEQDLNSNYHHELNVQRMAQAMIHALNEEENFSRESYDPPVHAKTLDSLITEDFSTGSDQIEEAETELSSHFKTSNPILQQSDMSVIAKKDSYLKAVLNCKETLERDQGEKMYVSYWDYAGQSTYYATHHLFMSPSAVYLLVIDLRKELEDKVTDNLEFRSGVLHSCTVAEALQFWTRSIQAYTKDEHGGYAPIIIVGTHRGYVKDEENVERKFTTIRKLLNTNAECIAIDNTLDTKEDESLNMLKNKIIDVGLGILDEKVSAQWISLEYGMQTNNICEKGYIKFSDLQMLDKETDWPMCNDVRLEAFLCHQHYRGLLLFYQHPDLKNLIITNPNMLIDFLNLLLRRSEHKPTASSFGWNEDGVLNQGYIQEIATKMMHIDEFACMIVLKILVELHILHPLSSTNEDCNQDKYFLPCLLPDEMTGDENEGDDCSKSPLFQIRFNLNHIHQTMFHQIVCALMKTLPVYETDGRRKEIYSRKVIFDVEDSLVLLFLNWHNSELAFFIEDFMKGRKKAMNKYVTEVVEYIEGAIDDILFVNRHELFGYTLLVECPRHQDAFLSVEKLKKHHAAICNGKGDGKHTVDINEINYVEVDGVDNKPENIDLLRAPTDAELGRLAWKIWTAGRGETASSLALRLKLPHAFAKADIITRDLDDPGAELLYLLITWRNQHIGHRTILLLLNLLTKQKDYDLTTLKEAMNAPAKTHPGIDTIPASVSAENRDICIISQLMGRGYTFALIEMGIVWTEIEQERITHRYDFREMLFQLLLRWRRRDPENSTIKKILEAAKMVDIPINHIVTRLCEDFPPNV